jgi:hypothetical protein
VSKYKLSVLEEVDFAYQTACSSLKTPELEKVARALVGNIDRVVSAGIFPVGLLNFRTVFWQIWRRAQENLLGEYDPKYPSSHYHQWGALRNQMPDECLKLTKEWPPHLSGMPKPWSREWLIEQAKIYESGGFMHPGWLQLEAMIACSEDFLAHGIEATLSGMLVGMWTAFETLAGDLWVQSVNAQPKYLAGLTGTANRIQKLVRSGAKRQQETKKGNKTAGTASGEDDACEILSQREVTLGMMCKVTEGTYNLSDKMGTLLIETKRVQFTNLEAIREAYSLAFSENVRRARTDKIDMTLADRELDALSAVRNLIVHKAGKADSMYLDDCKSAPTAPKIKEENEKLQLDGEVCQSLIAPVLKLSVDLINAVDTWLTTTHD